MKNKDWSISKWIKKKLNIDISDVQYNEHTTLEEVLKNGTVVEAIPDHVVDFIEAKNKLNKGEKWKVLKAYISQMV